MAGHERRMRPGHEVSKAAGRLKTDGFALSPQNGAAGTASLGVSDLAGDGISERSPSRP